jgi:hypothetical protein
MNYEDFEVELGRYEAATVELVNMAPPASDLACQAIDNLRQCQQMRLQLKGTSIEKLIGRARRLSDFYPEAELDKHHLGVDRRS